MNFFWSTTKAVPPWAWLEPDSPTDRQQGRRSWGQWIMVEITWRDSPLLLSHTHNTSHYPWQKMYKLVIKSLFFKLNFKKVLLPQYVEVPFKPWQRPPPLYILLPLGNVCKNPTALPLYVTQICIQKLDIVHGSLVKSQQHSSSYLTRIHGVLWQK